MICDVCGASMRPDVLPQTFQCGNCGFFKSSFPVRINEPMAVDEGVREVGLKPLRMATFERLLDDIADVIPPQASLLDVGCAHGWFLEAAAARGYRATGLEPDREVAKRSNGNVIVGYFPDAVSDSYQVISFNDVFEHLPDPGRMMDAVVNHLEPGGHAVFNIPVSNGIAFALTRLAARLGIRAPYERIWQKPYVSPHVSYFSPDNLTALAHQNGLELVRSGRLDSIQVKGLWERIGCDQSVRGVKLVAYYIGGLMLAAVSRLAPSDIRFFVFKKIGSS